MVLQRPYFLTVLDLPYLQKVSIIEWNTSFQFMSVFWMNVQKYILETEEKKNVTGTGVETV